MIFFSFPFSSSFLLRLSSPSPFLHSFSFSPFFFLFFFHSRQTSRPRQTHFEVLFFFTLSFDSREGAVWKNYFSEGERFLAFSHSFFFFFNFFIFFIFFFIFLFFLRGFLKNDDQWKLLFVKTMRSFGGEKERTVDFGICIFRACRPKKK